MEQETLYNVLSGAYGEVLETHAMWECIASLGIKPYKDGNQWCYLYGDNIQDGIVGFGETIFKAAWNFYSQVKTEEIAKCEHRGISKIQKDLEEAAGEYEKKHTYQRYDGGGLTPEYDATLAEAFIAGYNLCKEQMLKEAVDAIVDDWNPDPEPEITIPLNPEEFTCGDKVRVIILPKES